MENEIEKLEQDRIIQIPKALNNDFTQLYSTKSVSECDSCENICQNVCEHGSQCSCQAVCQDACQYSDQCDSCENYCQDYCQYECQSNCELNCQYACEDTCEVGCQVNCQDACEITTQKPKVGATVTITNITANSATARITINDATEIDLQVKDTVTDDWVWDGDFSIVRPVTTISLDGLAPNRQYFYYIVDDINGKSSTKYFTTLSGRPKNWVCTTDFYSGKHLPVHPTNKTYVILPAYEWTEFQNRINEFRDYTKLPHYGFTNVSRGTHFTNTIWNEAVYAICNMTDNSYQNIRKFEADNGSIINASLFQSLANELNSIP